MKIVAQGRNAVRRSPFGPVIRRSEPASASLKLKHDASTTSMRPEPCTGTVSGSDLTSIASASTPSSVSTRTR